MDILFWAHENLSTLFTILFYVGIFAIVYFNRKKFEVQSGFIFLLRTKIGLKFIDRFSKKHKELLKLLGYIGIGIGFLGMVFISYTLIKNLYDVSFVPGAQSAVTPALPGVKVPGSPIFIPLIAGWIALFIVTVVHEFSHGIVASSHGLRIKSSGVAFFGPIMGAFVEPDEKVLNRKSDVVKYSIFAAGPFSNILLTIVALVLILIVASPLLSTMTVPAGFSFQGVTKGLPAEAAGIMPGMVFTSVNGVAVTNESYFVDVMDKSKPGDKVVIATSSQSFEMTTAVHPDNKDKGYIGVSGVGTYFELKQKNAITKIAYWLIQQFGELMWLVFLLSSGIGIVNLLPLGPIDGGRMLQVSLVKVKGKKKGMGWWKSISLFFLIVLLLNVFLPLALNLLRKIF
jgi:membrane-associated protease RseP (regulator of RpoE activity)